MAFTDRQTLLWDDIEDLELRKRNTPLDGHPQEWWARHYIIKITTLLGKDFYLWNPGQPVIWTEDRKGAYRYSYTEMGRLARDSDLMEAKMNVEERGVDGVVSFELVNA